MDGKNRSIGGTIRTAIIFLWVVISVIIYGTLCLCIAPFSLKTARRLSFLWSKQLLFFAGITVKVQGLNKLNVNRRYIFVANHQSHIDIPVLFASLNHQLSFIAKKELFVIPFFGWGMYVQGHIWIDRGNARKAHASIQRAIERLRKGNISLVLFPEGTRSKDGTLGRFKQGSFSLVKQAGVEVVPLAINKTAQILSKHSRQINSGIVYLTVCEPVKVDEEMTKAEISDMLRNKIQTVLNDLSI